MKERDLAFKYDDDGEPSGSSGRPVFKVLELKEILNAVVVVTRYFGGTKLGFGGLSRAYREAALSAIEEAGIIEIFEQARFRICAGYPESQKLKKIIDKYGNIEEEKYTVNVEFILLVRKDLENDFIEEIKTQTKNKIEYKRL